jgi:hypothetical protein
MTMVISWWSVVSVFRVEALMTCYFTHYVGSRCSVLVLSFVMYALDSSVLNNF